MTDSFLIVKDTDNIWGNQNEVKTVIFTLMLALHIINVSVLAFLQQIYIEQVFLVL